MLRRAHKIVAVIILAACWLALGAGCVTVGYDFLKQQATITYTHPPKTDGYKK